MSPCSAGGGYPPTDAASEKLPASRSHPDCGQRASPETPGGRKEDSGAGRFRSLPGAPVVGSQPRDFRIAARSRSTQRGRLCKTGTQTDWRPDTCTADRILKLKAAISMAVSLPCLQFKDHPDYGMAPAPLRLSHDGWCDQCRELSLTSS